MILTLNVNKKSVPAIIKMLKRSIYYSSGIQDDGRTTKKEQVELAKDKEFIWNLIREIDAQYLRN